MYLPVQGATVEVSAKIKIEHSKLEIWIGKKNRINKFSAEQNFIYLPQIELNLLTAAAGPKLCLFDLIKITQFTKNLESTNVIL